MPVVVCAVKDKASAVKTKGKNKLSGSLCTQRSSSVRSFFLATSCTQHLCVNSLLAAAAKRQLNAAPSEDVRATKKVSSVSEQQPAADKKGTEKDPLDPGKCHGMSMSISISSMHSMQRVAV